MKKIASDKIMEIYVILLLFIFFINIKYNYNLFVTYNKLLRFITNDEYFAFKGNNIINLK